jgi:hypothetical protein
VPGVNYGPKLHPPACLNCCDGNTFLDGKYWAEDVQPRNISVATTPKDVSNKENIRPSSKFTNYGKRPPEELFEFTRQKVKEAKRSKEQVLSHNLSFIPLLTFFSSFSFAKLARKDKIITDLTVTAI